MSFVSILNEAFLEEKKTSTMTRTTNGPTRLDSKVESCDTVTKVVESLAFKESFATDDH